MKVLALLMVLVLVVSCGSDGYEVVRTTPTDPVTVEISDGMYALTAGTEWFLVEIDGPQITISAGDSAKANSRYYHGLYDLSGGTMRVTVDRYSPEECPVNNKMFEYSFKRGTLILTNTGEYIEGKLVEIENSVTVVLEALPEGSDDLLSSMLDVGYTAECDF